MQDSTGGCPTSCQPSISSESRCADRAFDRERPAVSTAPGTGSSEEDAPWPSSSEEDAPWSVLRLLRWRSVEALCDVVGKPTDFDAVKVVARCEPLDCDAVHSEHLAASPAVEIELNLLLDRQQEPVRPRAARPASRKEALRRKINALLNKITSETFHRIASQLADAEWRSEEDVLMLGSSIFDVAVTEHEFCELYSDMCLILLDRIPSFPLSSQEPSLEAPSLFAQALLCCCQEEFGRLPVTVERLTSQVGTSLEQSEELELELSKAKERLRGTMKFIGQLYLRRIVSTRILRLVVRRLLSEEHPPSHNLECIVALLRVVGSALAARRAGQALLRDCMPRLQRLSIASAGYATRIRFLLEDVLKLWQAWLGVLEPSASDDLPTRLIHLTQAFTLTQNPDSALVGWQALKLSDCEARLGVCLLCDVAVASRQEVLVELVTQLAALQAVPWPALVETLDRLLRGGSSASTWFACELLVRIACLRAWPGLSLLLECNLDAGLLADVLRRVADRAGIKVQRATLQAMLPRLRKLMGDDLAVHQHLADAGALVDPFAAGWPRLQMSFAHKDFSAEAVRGLFAEGLRQSDVALGTAAEIFALQLMTELLRVVKTEPGSWRHRLLPVSNTLLQFCRPDGSGRTVVVDALCFASNRLALDSSASQEILEVLCEVFNLEVEDLQTWLGDPLNVPEWHGERRQFGEIVRRIATQLPGGAAT